MTNTSWPKEVIPTKMSPTKIRMAWILKKSETMTTKPSTKREELLEAQEEAKKDAGGDWHGKLRVVFTTNESSA